MRNLSRFKPLILAVAVSVLVSAACALFASKKIVRNITDSLPHGIYYISAPTDLSYGDIVCFAVPAKVAGIVYGRGWLQNGGVMLKNIVAMPGDRVCSDGRRFTIKTALNARTGVIQSKDGRGRPLPVIRLCGVLPKGLLFVGHPEDPRSFDSRYFGPIQRKSIIGVAKPLWIF